MYGVTARGAAAATAARGVKFCTAVGTPWEKKREFKAHQPGQRPINSLFPHSVRPIPPPDWQLSVSPCWAAPAPPKSIAKRSGHSDPTTDQQMHISVGSRGPTGHVPRKKKFQSMFTQHITHRATTVIFQKVPTEKTPSTSWNRRHDLKKSPRISDRTQEITCLTNFYS